MVYSVQETEVNQKLIPKIWGIRFSWNMLPLFYDFEGWFGNKEKRAWVGIQRHGIRGRGKKKELPPLVLFYHKQLFFSVDPMDPHP